MAESSSTNDGKTHVALELARWIAEVEEGAKQDRKYLLKLMHDCVRVVNGNAPP
jgi:hypothetical protein